MNIADQEIVQRFRNIVNEIVCTGKQLNFSSLVTLANDNKAVLDIMKFPDNYQPDLSYLKYQADQKKFIDDVFSYVYVTIGILSLGITFN